MFFVCLHLSVSFPFHLSRLESIGTARLSFQFLFQNTFPNQVSTSHFFFFFCLSMSISVLKKLFQCFLFWIMQYFCVFCSAHVCTFQFRFRFAFPVWNPFGLRVYLFSSCSRKYIFIKNNSIAAKCYHHHGFVQLSQNDARGHSTVSFVYCCFSEQHYTCLWPSLSR